MKLKTENQPEDKMLTHYHPSNIPPATGVSATPADADFTQLSANALALANQLGMEIIGCAKGFNAFKDGDIISKDCTASEIEQWLEGYANGQDEAAGNLIGELVDELAKADTIIQALKAQMNDEQKLAAADSLFIAGFPADGASRGKERLELIEAVRGVTLIEGDAA